MTRTHSRRSFLGRSILASTATALSAVTYRRVHGANERIGIGFIGYGLIGKRHVDDFMREADVDPIAVAEVHRGRLEEGRAVLGSQSTGYGDFRRLLDNRRVDAVVVSTPDHWHALMTMLACAAGKDVYVEKPLTLFVREGRWMIDVAKRTGRVVQVGTQQRSGLHYQRAKALVTGGKLGTIMAVRMQAVRNIGKGFGRVEDTAPPPELDWDMWLGPAPQRPYNPHRALYHFRWFWDTSGGQMTNLGAHHLDIVDWFLGLKRLQNAMSVGGRYILDDGGETPDTQDALWDFGDFNATCSIRECSRGENPSPGLEFLGTNGSLSISRGGFKLTPDAITPAANQIPGIGEHPVGGPAKVETSATKQFRTEPIENKTGDSDEQYRRHVRNFLDAIKTRAQPISDLESAQRTSVACHLANISLRLGRGLRWNPQIESIVDDPEANSWLVRPYRAPWDRELAALGVS